jgi:hypothetical protein
MSKRGKVLPPITCGKYDVSRQLAPNRAVGDQADADAAGGLNCPSHTLTVPVRYLTVERRCFTKFDDVILDYALFHVLSRALIGDFAETIFEPARRKAIIKAAMFAEQVEQIHFGMAIALCERADELFLSSSHCSGFADRHDTLLIHLEKPRDGNRRALVVSQSHFVNCGIRVGWW